MGSLFVFPRALPAFCHPAQDDWYCKVKVLLMAEPDHGLAVNVATVAFVKGPRAICVTDV